MPIYDTFAKQSWYTVQEVDEMLRKIKGGSTGAGGSSGILPTPEIVTAWTSSGGRWYYNLYHTRKSMAVFLIAFDTMADPPGEINIDEKEYVNENNTKIWLTWQPAANRIILYYI